MNYIEGQDFHQDNHSANNFPQNPGSNFPSNISLETQASIPSYYNQYPNYSCLENGVFSPDNPYFHKNFNYTDQFRNGCTCNFSYSHRHRDENANRYNDLRLPMFVNSKPNFIEPNPSGFQFQSLNNDSGNFSRGQQFYINPFNTYNNDNTDYTFNQHHQENIYHPECDCKNCLGNNFNYINPNNNIGDINQVLINSQNFPNQQQVKMKRDNGYSYIHKTSIPVNTSTQVRLLLKVSPFIGLIIQLIYFFFNLFKLRKNPTLFIM